MAVFFIWKRTKAGGGGGGSKRMKEKKKKKIQFRSGYVKILKKKKTIVPASGIKMILAIFIWQVNIDKLTQDPPPPYEEQQH